MRILGKFYNLHNISLQENFIGYPFVNRNVIDLMTSGLKHKNIGQTVEKSIMKLSLKNCYEW